MYFIGSTAFEVYFLSGAVLHLSSHDVSEILGCSENLKF